MELVPVPPELAIHTSMASHFSGGLPLYPVFTGHGGDSIGDSTGNAPRLEFFCTAPKMPLRQDCHQGADDVSGSNDGAIGSRMGE